MCGVNYDERLELQVVRRCKMAPMVALVVIVFGIIFMLLSLSGSFSKSK